MNTKSAFSTFLIFIGITGAVFAQCVRTSVLQRTPTYDVRGIATLEEFADGSVELRLSNDYFVAGGGPDIQIFLSNDPEEVEDGFFIDDISESGKTSGDTTYDLPADFDIDEYQYIVYRCVAFKVLWGNGTLSTSSCDTDMMNGGGDGGEMTAMCQETLTATTDWVADTLICPNDGLANVLELRNTLMIPAGNDYAYIITDEDTIIENVVLENGYDFEGSSLETQFVFGVSYMGNLTAQIGQPLRSITASECAIISGSTIFLVVRKEDCGEAFDCQMVNTTSNGETNLTICPSDGQADVITLTNNGNLTIGDNFSYLLTDDQNILEKVIKSNTHDFEGSGSGVNRVYAISHGGDLNLSLGEPISSITSDDCVQLSDMTVFLTVNKGGCAAATFNVSGQVTSPSGQPIEGVEIITNANSVLATTDSQGNYTIPAVEQGTSYTIRPRATTGLTNGVSATDGVRISRHVIGLDPFDDPYLIVAADVNNDNTVSGLDIVMLIRVVVGLSTEFNNNSAWRFVDASQAFDGGNPLDGHIFESVDINISNADINNLDFIGVKIGDVNANADLDLNE